MTIGLFHTRLIVANPVIGGPVLTLDLLVDTPKKRVSGVARVTQSTSPPVQFRADVWGDYSQVKLDPSSEGHIILSLAGNPSGPTSQIAETFQLQGILGLDWASGFASYKYQYQGHWHVVQHAAVSQAPVDQKYSERRPRPTRRTCIRIRCTQWRCRRPRAVAIWRGSRPWWPRASSNWPTVTT